MIAFSLSPRAGKTACRLALAALLLALAGQTWAQQAPHESLGEYARQLRMSKKTAVAVSAEDAEQLFRSVDEITKFDSSDSGFPKLSPVRRKLIGQTEAEKHFRSEGEDEARHDRRLDESAIVLKKFGMLPADFDLNAKLGDITLSGLAGFYDFSDKTMYLLNWISPDLQAMVMAHELTHALQDQNYHLSKFAMRPPEAEARQMKTEDDESESFLARRAVVEGQATLVGDDYEIRDLGISLANSPEARERVITHLQSSYDLPVTINNAPRLLREVMIFPYREGLIFELELLDRGGREEAFREPYQRPPLNTHQILQPEAYFAHEKASQIAIGDLAPVFGKDYVAYDSGSIGEFDVQVMSEEFGRENDIYSVARQWNGGAYVAVKRAELAAGSAVKTSDLALVYVSRWKSQKAAERFGQIYLDAMAKRLPMSVPKQGQCDEEPCRGPLWERHADSSEGPVNIEIWPGDLLIITQSVDQARMQALRPILLAQDKAVRASAAAPERNQPGLNQPELAARLLAMPQVKALSELEGLALGVELRHLLAH